MCNKYCFSFKCVVVLLILQYSAKGEWITADGLENELSQEDLIEFLKIRNADASNTTEDGLYYYPGDIVINNRYNFGTESVNCFGLEKIGNRLKWFFDMKPEKPGTINTHFYISSPNSLSRTQVRLNEDFNLTEVNFDPSLNTVMIIHGFMSHSNASWVRDMANAFIEKENVNVIAVDWSGGGSSWKYWRAVANTRRAGCEISKFIKFLMNKTGITKKSIHCVGHSLGAHICSYVSHNLGGFRRITGLDPAQPCFQTSNANERLDPSDADFVDIIHTNGRLLTKIGLGLPNPIGHADFYPNGGVKQPGCTVTNSTSFWDKLLAITFSEIQQAICSHGRSYDLLIESLTNDRCDFVSRRWDLSYEGAVMSLQNVSCEGTGACAEMGIAASGERRLPRAHGSYVLATKDQTPFCAKVAEHKSWLHNLLKELQAEFSFPKKEKESLSLSFVDDGSISDTNFKCDYQEKDSNSAIKPYWLLTCIGVIYSYFV